MGLHEPCQAGNRAALSGMFCAPQVSCPLYTQQHTGVELCRGLSIFYVQEVTGLCIVLFIANGVRKRLKNVVGQTEITTALKKSDFA